MERKLVVVSSDKRIEIDQFPSKDELKKLFPGESFIQIVISWVDRKTGNPHSDKKKSKSVKTHYKQRQKTRWVNL